MKGKKRDYLTDLDLGADEIFPLFEKARELKAKTKRGEPHPLLAGRTLVMIFDKSSTRTRISFEVGMFQLGGQSIFLNPQASQLGRGEPICDTARIVSGYAHGLMVRTFGHHLVEDYARSASVPVINGLTDLFHPCQALTDFFTLWEMRGDNLRDLRVAWIGDGNNVVNSYILMAARLGFELRIACPAGYEPSAAALEMARAAGPCRISIMRDPFEAVEKADVISTDVWASMGQEDEAEKRRRAFKNYQVNNELLAAAGPQARVMHCLPAHRGEEITAEALEGPQSIVFQQAENRLHAQKALLALLLG